MPIFFHDKEIKRIDLISYKKLGQERCMPDEKRESTSLEIIESKARKRVRDFVIRMQNSPKIFDSARLPFLRQPGLLLFLRSPASEPCRRLLMKLDLWYNYLSLKTFEKDCYFSEPKMTGQRDYRCKFYSNIFKIEERPCLVFCEEKDEPLNYIVIGSAALEILMRGGQQTQLFAVLDFFDVLWSTGFSPFQMTENTMRDMLTWVSVGHGSKEKPKALRKKPLWQSFRINRVPFWNDISSKGGQTAK